MMKQRLKFPAKQLFSRLLMGGALFAFLTAGYCERYERKQERHRLMKQHIDSMRTAAQNRKDSIWKAEQAQLPPKDTLAE